MNKAPDAFRTISEVAVELDLPQHVLRFWESRFQHVKPMKRGGGRRYYRPDDVELLRGIRHLLYGQGYTIRGVQKILREQGPRFVQTVWHEGAPQPTSPPEPEMEESGRADDGVGTGWTEAVEDIDMRTGAVAEAGATELGGGESSVVTGVLTLRAEANDTPSGPVGSGEEREDEGGERIQRAVAPIPVAGLSVADRQRLQAALDQLDACKRMLDDALTEAEPAS